MKKLSLVYLASLLLLTASVASAQSRRQPLKFQVTTVDAKTLKPRSTFVLGESVAVRFSVTNQGRVARTISVLPDTFITFKLHSTEPYEHHPEVTEGYFGGTGWTRQMGNMIVWGESAPRKMKIAPGQTVSRVMYTDRLREHPIEEGTHTLTANYNENLRATVVFQVVVDEEKSIPLLEKIAATPVDKGDDSLQRWARATLNLVREPSITGRVVDDEGRPLYDIEIEVTGPTKTVVETRRSGRYILDLLTKGATYTVAPNVSYYTDPGEPRYVIEPASRTVTVLERKITNIDFVARRIRTEKNFALDDEGSRIKASSIKDWMYEPEHVIDRYRMVPVGDRAPAYWVDGTPNVFPDWIEVDFGVTRKFEWINVFTLPDNLNDPPDPEPNEKFSLHGITDFDVQYWTGSAWRTVPGGAIRNNRNVWRKISFPEITTKKIRVVVLNALGGESRITEIEAVHLNDLPVAKIGVEGNAKKSGNVTGYTNSAMQFVIDASDRDGRIEHLELDFDNGMYEWTRDRKKLDDKPQLRHSRVFTETGTYNVTLWVVDDSEESTRTTVVVTIIERPEEKVKAKKTSGR